MKIFSLEKKENLILLVSCIIGIPGLLLYVLKIIYEPNGITFCDFKIYYNTVINYIQNPNLQDYNGYLYPPFFLFYIYPLSFLSYENALLVFNVIKIFTFAISMFFFFKILDHYEIRFPSLYKYLFSLSLFFFYPFRSDFITGNINILIFSFIVLFYYFTFVKKKLMFSSTFISLGTLLKLSPFPLIYFIYKKSSKYTILTFILILLLSFVALMSFGTQSYTNFINFFSTKEKQCLQVANIPMTFTFPSDVIQDKISFISTVSRLFKFFFGFDLYPFGFILI